MMDPSPCIHKVADLMKMEDKDHCALCVCLERDAARADLAAAKARIEELERQCEEYSGQLNQVWSERAPAPGPAEPTPTIPERSAWDQLVEAIHGALYCDEKNREWRAAQGVAALRSLIAGRVPEHPPAPAAKPEPAAAPPLAKGQAARIRARLAALKSNTELHRESVSGGSDAQLDGFRRATNTALQDIQMAERDIAAILAEPAPAGDSVPRSVVLDAFDDFSKSDCDNNWTAEYFSGYLADAERRATEAPAR